MLSKAAEQALINAKHYGQGAKVSDLAEAHVAAELFRAGLIGMGNGLTRKGTIRRQQLMEAALDAAF